jgi:hypothetical protein
VKRTILAVSACLSVSPACAANWSLSSTLSETVELNDNPFLRAVAAGALSSYSNILANATARTPRSLFTFNGNVGYQKYWGPGVEGVQSENLTGGVNLHYETIGKNNADRQYLDASWRRSSAAFALLGQLGIVTNTRGFVDATTVGGGIDRSLTARDTISLSARSTYTSYDPGTGGIPFIDTVASGTWRHRVNSIASLSASSDAEFLHYDNALNTDIMILRETAGIDAALSPLLSFRGNAGIAYVQVEGGSPAFSPLPQSPTAAGSGSVAGFIGNMVLTYKMFPDTTLAFTGIRSVSPSTVGSLIQLTSFGAGLTYNINSRQTLSLLADASRTTSVGTTGDFLSAGITYSYLLTREWTAQLSYRHLHRLPTTGSSSAGFIVDPLSGIPIPIVSGTGAAASNSLMMVVSRSINILPGGN